MKNQDDGTLSLFDDFPPAPTITPAKETAPKKPRVKRKTPVTEAAPELPPVDQGTQVETTLQ